MREEVNLAILEAFSQLNDIPEIPKKPKTFLGIARQPHFENVLSNIYAFFLDPNEEHGFDGLFIDALIAVISSKLNKQIYPFDISDPEESIEVNREYSTKNNGRIDILLRNPTHAIIIENKIYHVLGNDLNDYRETLVQEGYKKENIFGIVLSLYNQDSNNRNEFINLTHLELVDELEKSLDSYDTTTLTKYHHFLRDLIQNIKNLTLSNMKTAQIDFYLKNSEKIREAANLKEAFEYHLFNEAGKAGDRLYDVKVLQMNKGTSKTQRLRYFTSKKYENLRIVPVYEGLLKGENKMFIAVELRNNLLNDKSFLDQVEFDESERELIQKCSESFMQSTNIKWAHFVSVDYQPTPEEIENFSGYLYERIMNDNLHSIFKKNRRLPT